MIEVAAGLVSPEASQLYTVFSMSSHSHPSECLYVVMSSY